MDSPIIDARFIAMAYQHKGFWYTSVREVYSGRGEEVASWERHPAVTQYEDEAWSRLTGAGWTFESPSVHQEDWVGMQRAVEPPADATVNPVTPQECEFIRRCAARGVPAMTAMRAWSQGATCPQTVAHAYRWNQRMTDYTQIPFAAGARA